MTIKAIGKRCFVAIVLCLLVAAAIWGRKFCRRLTSEGTPRNVAPVSSTDLRLPQLQDPRILIEKSARRLTVLDGDTSVKSYRLGLGWGTGDKAREGDGCTPEGKFYVCVKNPNSRFYLSLGLSYPNIEDAQRGLRDGLIDQDESEKIANAIRSKGVPPWKTALGGEIMIHGHGSASDWTLGCVALENEDIAELYKAVAVGTPVEIVP